VVLDIEGTTSPISFVTDVLFPYARDNVRKHLDATYGSDETNDDIALLRAQVVYLSFHCSYHGRPAEEWLPSRASF
jgi:methionine salvage enolase-phosphatase E1